MVIDDILLKYLILLIGQYIRTCFSTDFCFPLRLCVCHVHDKTERHSGHQGLTSFADHGGMYVSVSGEVCGHSKGKGPETYAADASEPLGSCGHWKQRPYRPVPGPRRACQPADERNFGIKIFAFYFGNLYHTRDEYYYCFLNREEGAFSQDNFFFLFNNFTLMCFSYLEHLCFSLTWCGVCIVRTP